MGLAVGIDYSLFIVSRFREERGSGRGVSEAVAAAGATANRAVFFSGMTVVLALLGMSIVPYSVFTSLGAGAVTVVVAAVAVALTLLPAALRLLGDRVNMLRVRLPWRHPAAPGAAPIGSVTAEPATTAGAVLPVTTVAARPAIIGQAGGRGPRPSSCAGPRSAWCWAPPCSSR